MAFLIPFIPQIIGAVATVGAAYVAAKASAPKQQQQPTPVATPEAPTMNSASILASQQASAAQQSARSGRLSTILSQGTSPTDSGKLGG